MLDNQGLKQGDDRCRPRLPIGTPRGKLVQVGFGDPYGDSVSVILSSPAGEDPCDDAIEFVKDVERKRKEAFAWDRGGYGTAAQRIELRRADARCMSTFWERLSLAARCPSAVRVQKNAGFPLPCGMPPGFLFWSMEVYSSFIS